MALFKISKGSKNNLPTTLTEGYCWYTFEDSKFYIDFKDENGVLTRKALSAENAETLCGLSLDELKAELKLYIDDAIEDAGASSGDLTGYATEEYVNEKIAGYTVEPDELGGDPYITIKGQSVNIGNGYLVSISGQEVSTTANGPIQLSSSLGTQIVAENNAQIHTEGDVILQATQGIQLNSASIKINGVDLDTYIQTKVQACVDNIILNGAW